MLTTTLLRNSSGLGSASRNCPQKEISEAKNEALSQIAKEVSQHEESIRMLIRTGNELSNKLADLNKAAGVEAANVQRALSELERRTAPRHLSEGQRQAMLPIITKLKGRPIAFACRLWDGESCDYAAELVAFFKEAGCIVPELNKGSLNDSPGYVLLTTHGNADPDVVKVLETAFKAAEIPAKIEAIKENSMPGLVQRNSVRHCWAQSSMICGMSVYQTS